MQYSSDDMTQMMNVAKAMALSGMFPDLIWEKDLSPADFSHEELAARAFVKILAGRELGLGHVASMMSLNIMKGKIEAGAGFMAASLKASPKYDFKVLEKTPQRVAIEFLEKVGEEWVSLGVEDWPMARAKKANLGGRNWNAFPEAMLYARAMSAGIRAYAPDGLGFAAPVYAEGELGGEVKTTEVPKPEEKGELPDAWGDPPEPEPAEDPEAPEGEVDPPDGGKETPPTETPGTDESQQDTAAALAGEDPDPVEHPDPRYADENGEIRKGVTGMQFDEWFGLSPDEARKAGVPAPQLIENIDATLKKLGGSLSDLEGPWLEREFGHPYAWMLTPQGAMKLMGMAQRKLKAKKD